MGSKFSKASKKAKEDEKKWDDLPTEGRSKYSTLPASFRRKTNQPEEDQDVGKTGTLPRNLSRNPSFSKRVRKSVRSWAATKGFVDPCKVKANGETDPAVTQSQESTKPSSVVLSATECKDKIADVEQTDELTKAESNNVTSEDKTEVIVEAKAELDQEQPPKKEEEEAVVLETKPVTTEEPNKEEARAASEESFVIVEKDDVKEEELQADLQCNVPEEATANQENESDNTKGEENVTEHVKEEQTVNDEIKEENSVSEPVNQEEPVANEPKDEPMSEETTLTEVETEQVESAPTTEIEKEQTESVQEKQEETKETKEAVISPDKLEEQEGGC